MARKKLATAIGKTASKVSGRGSFLKKAQTAAFYGDEPRYVEGTNYNTYFIQYLNWANIMFDSQTLKDHFMEYATNNDFDTKEISSMASYYFNTLGKLSYLFNKSREVTDYVKNKLDEAIFVLIDDCIKIQEVVEPEIIQLKEPDKNLQEYWSLYQTIDSLIEKKEITDENISQLLNDNQPSMKTIKMVQDHYSENYNDWQNETGSREYKKIVKTYLDIYNLINKQISAYVINLENTKAAVRKPRKPRKVKEKPASKLVENLSYKKNDNTIGVTSIAPESIIGVKALAVFNTKTRKFGVFYSNSENGLTVKGTTILNFDEDKSICKTLRKPSEQLAALTGSTMKRMEMVMREIKAVDTKLKGRINEDVLLLKVFK